MTAFPQIYPLLHEKPLIKSNINQQPPKTVIQKATNTIKTETKSNDPIHFIQPTPTNKSYKINKSNAKKLLPIPPLLTPT